MTKREAIIRLIQKKPVGYTPHHFDLTMKITDELAAYYGIASDEVEDFIGNHMLYLDFGAPAGSKTGYRATTTNDQAYQDEFGVTWDNARLYDIGDWAMADHPVRDLDLTGYQFPDGTGEGRYEGAVRLMERFPGRFNVLRMPGLFDTCWHITGLQDFMVAMMVEEDTATEILDHCTEYMINVIRSAPEGIDAVRLIEDWGMQKGLMFSKELWMKYLKPRLQKIHAACREKGMYVMHHTCGDVVELFDEIVGLGIDIIDAIQPEAMDIAMLKRRWGDQIVMFGGLSAQHILPTGTPEEVVAEAEQAVKTMSVNGGYIIGPAGSFSTDTPVENVVALTEFCRSLKDRGM